MLPWVLVFCRGGCPPGETGASGTPSPTSTSPSALTTSTPPASRTRAATCMTPPSSASASPARRTVSVVKGVHGVWRWRQSSRPNTCTQDRAGGGQQRIHVYKRWTLDGVFHLICVSRPLLYWPHEGHTSAWQQVVDEARSTKEVNVCLGLKESAIIGWQPKHVRYAKGLPVERAQTLEASKI